MDVLERLLALAEPGYREFSRKMIPTQAETLGVRAPNLAKLSAEVLKGDFRAFLDSAPDGVLEVLLLKATALGSRAMDLPERLERVAAFLPKIDNWAVCDTLMGALEPRPGERGRYFEFLAPLFGDGREFFARFAAVMLIHFSDPEWIDRALAALPLIRQPDYYARMGVAWALSDLYVDFPEKTAALLASNALEPWTHNKAIQKVIESRRVDQAAKDALRALKRSTRPKRG